MDIFENRQINLDWRKKNMSYRSIESPRSIPQSPRSFNTISQTSLTPNEVSKLTNTNFRQGQSVKGRSQISYMPYQRKVTQYEQRTYIERVPIKRKVIEYEERKIIQNVPREVIKTDYYAVENITQYYKEVIPEKKIQMRPVQRKIRKIQYTPVEKQVIHYPEGHNEEFAKSQSRTILQNQGVHVKNDAEYRKIDPKLIYNYSTHYRENPIGYVQNGYERNLSTAPTNYNPSQSYVTQVYPSSPNHRDTYISPPKYQYSSASPYQRPFHQQYFPSRPSQTTYLKISNNNNTKSPRSSNYYQNGPYQSYFSSPKPS